MGKKSHILGLCVKIKKINFKANKEGAASAEVSKCQQLLCGFKRERKNTSQKLHFDTNNTGGFAVGICWCMSGWVDGQGWKRVVTHSSSQMSLLSGS